MAVSQRNIITVIYTCYVLAQLIYDNPVLHWTFDTLNNSVLMEANLQRNFSALIPGKVNNALAVNQTRNQWIDLGVHPEACMTIPDTCCAAGGAITFWLRIINCSHHGGILTTINEISGFRIFCEQFDERKVYLAYVLDFQSGIDRVNIGIATGSGWFHVAFNFLGMNDGQGINIYHNGILVGIDSIFAKRSKYKCTSIRPRIVVGKFSTNPDFVHLPINSIVQVDELKFFNAALTQAEIRQLAQSSN